MSTPFRLEALDLRHDVAHFKCGRPSIDAFIRGPALTEQSLGLSSVTVAVEGTAATNGPPGSVPVVGFFSLSPALIPVEPVLLKALGLPAVPYARVGGYLLGRLGVDKALQGKRIGRALVAAAVDYARAGRAGTGGVFLALDAEDPGLVSYYENLGFTRLHTGTLKMVMRL